ncbi:MAG: N-acetylmuramic acid 6-phosphate etherase [Proteobacteria bacterium]|nr:N-acetylmuramic acid 6-phosphate etherase [Pseudomonadota bacterium]
MSRTEAVSPRYKGLDTWDDRDVLGALWESQMSAIAAIQPALPALTTAARAIVEHLRAAPASRLIYAGMGTSGLLAILDGMELSPTFGWPSDRLAFLMAGGDRGRLTLDGSAEDDAAAARPDVAALAIGRNDVVIGVSASGTTPYTVAVLKEARARGALTIGLANNPDTELLLAANVPVLLDTGPEVLAGSTRLAAGTAQRAALVMLSSLIMTRLGHVFDGLMVSVVANNAKLRARAGRMVQSITGARAEMAERALAEAGNQVKVAVLTLLGLTSDEAEQRLAATDGDLRRAIELSGQPGQQPGRPQDE